MIKISEINCKTKEVEVKIVYSWDDVSGVCNIDIKGSGDFRHHLVEEILFTLADKFNMGNHLDVAINKLKVRLDNLKEVK